MSDSLLFDERVEWFIDPVVDVDKLIVRESAGGRVVAEEVKAFVESAPAM